jgi:hypothetical protein
LKRSGTVVEYMDGRDLLQQYLTRGNGKDTLRFTDPAKLETCLRWCTPVEVQSYVGADRHQYTGIVGSQPYLVFFILKNGSTMDEGFAAADVPSFVKQYFAGQQ